MTWFDQRVADLQSGKTLPRGQQAIFQEVCQLDFSKMNDAQRVFSLLSIAQHFAGIEGIGETRIQLAQPSDQGTASATFLDAPDSFDVPLIRLDKKFFSAKTDPNIFVGLVLHELAHLKFTRRFYQEAGQLFPFERFLCNLIEDYRIERLMGETSRAWKTYLERTRLLLVEQDGLAHGLEEWLRLGELDRVLLLLGLFLFMPETLAARPDLQAWRLTDGTCVFHELQEIFATEPLEEDAVFTAAREILRRFRVCRDANRERDTDRLSLWPLQPDSSWGWSQMLNALEARSEVSESFEQKLLDDVEKLEQATAGESTELPSEHWNQQEATVRSPLPTVEKAVVETQRSRARYQLIARINAEVIRELQTLFADPDTHSPRRVPGQLAGRLDPRRLYRHSFDGRLFQQPSLGRRALVSTTVGLLIDASGSMTGWPESAALRLGVILCEAFQAARNVDIRIYSHVGTPHCCELSDLGDKQTAAGRLGSYSARVMANYDDLAIERVATLLETKPAARRVLFVLSDAQPTWRDPTAREELWAMTLTRDAVRQLRQRGWRVVGLTIGKGAGEYIYGEDRVHLRNPGEVATRFAPLLRSLFTA